MKKVASKYVCYFLRVGVVWLSFSAVAGCKKFINVNPPVNSLVSTNVYENDATAVSAVTGVFEQLSTSTNFIGGGNSGLISFTSVAGVSSDEMSLYPNTKNLALGQAYTNSLISTGQVLPYWTTLYNLVYLTNSAIAGLNGSSAVTTSLKQQLLGEVKFVRAFCYFYLVNMYGSVPLAITTNYNANAKIGRSPVDSVYSQIVADLKDAQSVLGDSYVSPNGGSTTERTLPNKSAATALLARVYLYLGDFSDAEAQASAVINDANYSLVGLDTVFLANNNEAIFQLEAVTPGYDTGDGYTYILTGGPNTAANPFYLSAGLLGTFEVGDRRQTAWISNHGTYYFANKYKVKGGSSGSVLTTEYLTLLRLGEQYLIRAEARAQLGESDPAVADINVIRQRAGLGGYTGLTDKQSLLSAILHERRVEFFCECGHRWLDLVRTGSADSVLGAPGNVCAMKGGTWVSSAQLFPIPETEIQSDPGLTQNPGYN